MTNTPKRWAALGLAAALCTVETWLLIHAQENWFNPVVAVTVISCIALAACPSLFDELTGGFRIAAWIGCGLLAAFVFGAVLDRSSHTVRLATATSESATESRGRIERELVSARDSLAYAKSKVEKETENGGCGPKCEAWKALEKTYQTSVDSYLSQLDAKKPVVANTGAKTLAELTGVSERFLLLIWPIPQPMAFQFIIWALVRVWSRKPRVSETVSAVVEPETGTGGGGKGFQAPRLIAGTDVTDREIEAVKDALAGGKTLTNDQLAALMKTTKGEASKRVTVAQSLGVVHKRRVGRHVAISLQHAH